MTWEEFINESARSLARCYNRAEFDSELNRIDGILERQSEVLPDFWKRVQERYRNEDKPMLKESTAAAALNALLTAANLILAQRAAKK